MVDLNVSDVLVEIIQIQSYLKEKFQDDLQSVVDYMTFENPLFDGKTIFDLIYTGRSQEAMEYIKNDFDGSMQ